MSEEKKPNAIIAGDAVYAGIDLNDCTEIKNSVVIKFESIDQMRQAIKSGVIKFDFMRVD